MFRGIFYALSNIETNIKEASIPEKTFVNRTARPKKLQF